MAREVIDLLSSPEQAVPAPGKTTSGKSSSGPKSALPSSTLSYDLLKQKDWVTLSSDDETQAPETLFKASSIVSPMQSLKTVSCPSNTSKPALSNRSIGNTGVYFHPDDFDTSVDLDASIVQPKTTESGLLGLDRKQMEEERLLRVRQKRDAEERHLQSSNVSSASLSMILKPPYIECSKLQFSSIAPTRPPKSKDTSNKGKVGFHILSDISDDTVDLDDDPFASPPAKRRRLSSSPVASTSQTAVAKRYGYKKSISSIETKHTSPRVKTSVLQRSKATSKVLESDPIIFTSSPDHLGDARRRKGKKRHICSEDEENEDDIFGAPFIKKNKTLARDSDDSSDDSVPEISKILAMTASNASSKRPISAIDKYETEKAEKKRHDEKARKEKNRKASKEAKDAEKERQHLEKEQKIREKQKAAELAKVNTLKTDKNISALEMIVDLPGSLDPKLSSQVQIFLGAHSVEHKEYESSHPIIKWRRKVAREYNEDLGYWDKVKPHIAIEEHIMYVMSANEFVDLATSEVEDKLDVHVVQLKSQFDSCKLIYLIEGLETWKRKNKTLRERQFKNAVRSYAELEEPAPSQRPRKKKEPEYVDEDVVEDALLKLQMLGTKVHQTETMVVTAEWILAFTLHISTIPYKTQLQSHDTAFCMESGQVKTGEGPAETLVKMLQEIFRITAPTAHGIAAEYPTVQSLIKAFNEHGPLALEHCRKCANRDGAFTDRRVGPSISKRVYNVFTCRDPGSWDV